MPVLLLLLALCLANACGQALASQTGTPEGKCTAYGWALHCHGVLPTRAQLTSKKVEKVIVYFLNNTYVQLDPATDMSADTQVSEIVIKNSTISAIQDGYFAGLVGKNRLREISFSRVDSKFAMNAETFAGLENDLRDLTMIGALSPSVNAFDSMRRLTKITLNLRSGYAYHNLILRIIENSPIKLIDLSEAAVTHLPWRTIAAWYAEVPEAELRFSSKALHCGQSVVPLRQLLTEHRNP